LKKSDDDWYARVFRTVLFPAWEGIVRRRPTLALLSELRRSQWLSADELRARQAAELVRLVHHAYAHVPLYRARFDALRLRPQDVRTPDDLRALPILTREEARDQAAARASTSDPLPAIRKETSGTSGQPFRFGYDAGSEHWRQAVKLRAYEWAGYRPGDRTLFFWGVQGRHPRLRIRAKVALDRRARRETHVPCAVMDRETLSRAASEIVERRPRVLVCYAQAGAELARFMLRQGTRAPTGLRIICGAERILPHDRRDLEQAFGTAVFDTYGCREVMLIASECEHREGLHVAMENLIVELVVRTSDGRLRPAEPGERGEVVVTDLHNYGMPFVRYATGDVAIAGTGERCPCGRGSTRIRAVEGRTSETIHDGAGNAVSGVALSYVFGGLETAIRRFQIVQSPDRSVTLRVVPDASFAERTIDELRERCARHLAGVLIRIEAVSDMPRSPAGKHRLVVAVG
jgi:phenylacetate-CoA ligase